MTTEHGDNPPQPNKPKKRRLEARHWVSMAAAVVAVVAAFSIMVCLPEQHRSFVSKFLISTWTVGLPLWFLFDYWMYYKPEEAKLEGKSLDEFKYG